jgi:hypothetical protein
MAKFGADSPKKIRRFLSKTLRLAQKPMALGPERGQIKRNRNQKPGRSAMNETKLMGSSAADSAGVIEGQNNWPLILRMTFPIELRYGIAFRVSRRGRTERAKRAPSTRFKGRRVQRAMTMAGAVIQCKSVSLKLPQPRCRSSNWQFLGPTQFKFWSGCSRCQR